MMLRKLSVGGGWRILAILGLTIWPSLAMGQGETKSEPHPTPPPTEAAAEEEAGGFSWGVDLDGVTQYNWRGTILNDSFSIQPNLWASYFGFTASAWFQIGTDSNDSEVEPISNTLEEIDLTLAWEHTFSSWTVGAGYIHYLYPGSEDVDPSNEVYASLGYDTMIAPSFSVYRDFDLKTWYFEVGLGPEFSLNDKLTFNPGVVAGFYMFDDAEESLGVDQALNRIEPSVALNYDLGSGFSASAHVHYVIPLTDEIEDYFQDQFWGGIGLHYEH